MGKEFITIKISTNRYRKVFLDNIADRAYSLIKQMSLNMYFVPLPIFYSLYNKS